MRGEGLLIFVTVGAQMPFDRLVRLVDDWAGENNRKDIVAQIGRTDYRPRNVQGRPFLEPPEFRRYMVDADGIVAHAGVGTILSALELGKPLLVMPRLARLGETRSDHQVATARHFLEEKMVLAAFNEDELLRQIEDLEKHSVNRRIGGQCSESLIARIREYALDELRTPPRE